MTEMRLTFTQYEALLNLSEMKPSPYQRNTHTQAQIQALAKIMAHDGVRQPIHISRRTDTICFGHGRKEAALLNGWRQFPVVYQDFGSEEEEYRVVQSDNGLSQWSALDLAAINTDIQSGMMGPFDIALLGIHDFVVEPSEKGSKESEEEKSKTQRECPSCGYEW